MTAIAFLPHQMTGMCMSMCMSMCMWKKSMCMCSCAPILNWFSLFQEKHGTA